MELKEALLKLPNLLERVEKFLTPSAPAAAPAPVAASAPPVAPPAPAGKPLKTKDGKTITPAGDMKVGCDVQMDGAACPDGTYELDGSDGSDIGSITVKDGKIVDFQPMAAPAPTPVAQVAAPVIPAPAPTKVTKYTETVFDAEFAKIDELKLAFTEQNKMLKELVIVVQAIAEQPAIPTKFSKKDGVVSATIDTVNESIEEFRKRNGL